jgi:hypothetical protein
MFPHADGENSDGTTHPLYWRKFGCILYLNDNFEDGEIYFPDKDIILKPKPGTLEWLHGVKETKNGERYNLASFWTDDKTKEIKYDYS